MKNIALYIPIVILASLVSSCVYVKRSVTTLDNMTKTSKYTHINAVDVSGDLFNIKIESSLDDTLRIYTYAKEIVTDGFSFNPVNPIDVYEHNGVLTVDAHSGKSVKKAIGYIKICVPQDMERISVRTRSKDISVKGVQVGVLDVRSRRADVKIDKCTVEKQSVRGYKTTIIR
ncbi:MAG: hypothetical protein PHD21_03910 [Flavobacteriales bacterium]|nr:hypothetical protein [Flavobacteriales bacterium]